MNKQIIQQINKVVPQLEFNKPNINFTINKRTNLSLKMVLYKVQQKIRRKKKKERRREGGNRERKKNLRRIKDQDTL